MSQTYLPEEIRSVTRADLLSQPMTYFERYPCMTGADVVELERLLAYKVQSASKPVDVLEWGLGGSTVYFTQFLRQVGSNWSWLAIEHDKQWHDKIIPNLGSLTEVWLYDKLGADPRARQTDMTDYVEAPLRAEPPRLYDIIIVDGRYRRRCLLTAAKSLKSSGLCLLHDADRSYYRSAYSAFRSHGRIPGTQWWCGRLWD